MSIPLPGLAFATAVATLIAGCQAAQAPAGASTVTDGELLARGDYLVRIAGCNDCHTAGYAEQQGNVDRSQWLTGSALGYKGPWGTTYAANLRITLAGMDEAQWLAYSATLRTRPIMPDFLLRQMDADDRRAIYRFIKSLGPGGRPAPAYLPPGQAPLPPFMELVLPATAAAHTGDAAPSG